MLVHPGCHLGDSWYYVDGDTVHAYYLVCPDTIERHTAWDIAHATSHNLIEWELHGVVLTRGRDDQWDGPCLATGSVVRHRDEYLMAYTGRWNEIGVATGLATSDDLHDWTKSQANPTSRAAAPYVVDRRWADRPPTHWRDPFLTELDGRLYQFTAASRSDRPADVSGTVGVAMLDDEGEWHLLPPLDVEPVARELECPQIRRVGSRWFLIFSCFPDLFARSVRDGPTNSMHHGTYAMVGPEPLGPYRFVQRQPIVPADHPDQPYAGQILHFADTHYLIGTVWRDDAPDYLSDPIPLSVEGDVLVTK